MSIYYTWFINLRLSKDDPSFIPLLVCVHLFFFTILSAGLPVLYGLTQIMNKVFQNVKFPKVIIRNKALKTIVNCYISEIDINDHYFLSSEFALLYLLLCYIISGILTVSDMGNALVVSITNIGLKMGNIDSKASRETDAVLTVYKYDLQLYKDMFLSAVIPLAIPQFVHALKQK